MMKIIVTACQVPFEKGGAEQMTRNFMQALNEAGHQAELVTFPFKFMPTDYIKDQMNYLKGLDFTQFTHHHPEKVISLQFPGYGVDHPNHTIWLIHQHRAVYELYHQETANDSIQQLRSAIHQYDNETLHKAKSIYTISNRVSSRLKTYNQIDSTPLYQPPPNAESFYNASDYGYIFFPSRVEPLKRQLLLIEAAQYTKTNVRFIIAGTGTAFSECQRKVAELGLHDKVIMMGRFSDQEKYALYARCLAVFFGPYDEDYGYITLEAQLSAKPVITCKDSGGPLEFIDHEANGFICDPDPSEIAAHCDWLYNHRHQASILGESGRLSYVKKNISWRNVVSTLTQS